MLKGFCFGPIFRFGPKALSPNIDGRMALNEIDGIWNFGRNFIHRVVEILFFDAMYNESCLGFSTHGNVPVGPVCQVNGGSIPEPKDDSLGQSPEQRKVEGSLRMRSGAWSHVVMC